MKKILEKSAKSKIIDGFKNKTLWFIIISICFAFMYSLVATKNLDFIPMNGDFQNYNPARRFLDGQIPFKDFSVYLGCGEMILDALGLLITGNTFANSLMVIRFFNGLIFWGFIYVISYLISDSHRFSSILSAGLFGIVSVVEFANINTVLEPGVSARLIRSGVLIVEIVLALAAINVIWRKDIPQNKKLMFTSIAVGFITGSGIIWSNDYGVASIICISVFYAISGIKIAQKFSTVLLNACVYILNAVIGFLLSVFIITRGNISSYFESIFSTSDFQNWYYRNDHFVNYRFFDIELKIMYLFGAILLIYNFILLLKAKNPIDILKSSLISSIFLTTIFASYLYHIVSGNSSLNTLNIVVMMYVASYTVFIIVQQIRRKKILSKLKSFRLFKRKTLEAIGLGVCVCMLIYQGGYKIYCDNENADYGKYLGNDIDGNLTEKLADPILNISKIIGDEEVFSVYASAIETYGGKFQPTGFDYIIHVLGDENRQKYLDTFKNGNYKYATTIIPSYSPYEFWVKNSNWFFYRELCSEYVPVYGFNPWILWTKNESNAETYDLSKAKLNIEKIDDFSAKLTIEYDKKITGTADVSISYNSKYNKSFFKTGNINKFVMACSVTEMNAINTSDKSFSEVFFNFCLPEQSDCYYVPITIKDGYGELLITTQPVGDVELTINSAKLHNIFDFDYIEGNLIKE